MKLEKQAVLLPCHSLEDFPLHHEGAEADGLISAWAALWHPRLLALSGVLPGWYRADYPPQTLAGHLFVIPAVSEHLILAGWPARATSEGAIVIRRQQTPDDILADVWSQLAAEPDSCDDELARDFQTLGYCYLQTELLTRQMRYMSNLDEVHLEREAVTGARAAVAGDATLAREHLRRCFEVLLEARERFYPADAYLIDLTLVAESTLGAALQSELDHPAVNLLLDGRTLAQLVEQHPQVATELKERLSRQEISLVVEGWQGGEWPLWPAEAILADLNRTRQVCREQFDIAPRVFGRRSYGLTPFLPGVLAGLGFQGGLHFTLDDGQFPKCDQSKSRWEGAGTSVLDVLGRLPVDASQAGSFAGFAKKMGETMDLDHIATVVFAHWPGQNSRWYEALRRMTHYAPVLGKWITLGEYFQLTASPGRLARFSADDYKSPYLAQDVAAGSTEPISRWQRFHRLHARRAQRSVLEALAEIVSGTSSTQAAADESGDSSEQLAIAERDVTAVAERLARALTVPGKAGNSVASSPPSTSPRGILLLNAASQQRRALVELRGPLESLRQHEAVLAAAPSTEGNCRAVVEVPAAGFVWLPHEQSQATPATPRAERGWFGRRRTTVAVEAAADRLANELIELVIDPQTGGIRTLRDRDHRSNLLSQQLAVRLVSTNKSTSSTWHDPEHDATYSNMVVESAEVARDGGLAAAITTRGRLVDDAGKQLASFEQSYRVESQSRQVDYRVTINCEHRWSGSPWKQYAAVRFAWADAEAELWRDVNGWAQPADGRRIEAASWLEIRSDTSRVALLTGGLPYHRRTAERKLDTLLVTGSEATKVFEMGIGVNLPATAAAARDFLSGPVAHVDDTACPPSGARGWLLHVDSRHALITHCEAWREDGRVVGCRMRLQETAGRAGSICLRTVYPIAAARQMDFQGEPLVELRPDGDAVSIEMAAGEWAEVWIRWAELA